MALMDQLAQIPAKIKEALASQPVLCRVFTCVVAVLLGYLFIEFTWNAYAFTMEMRYVAANILFLALTFAIFYFWGQQSRASIVAFWVVCLVLGIANYYVVSFKGQPVVPADLFALKTAAAVSGGYEYTPSWQMIVSICVFVAASAALLLTPKLKLSKKLLAINCAAALVLSAGSLTYIHKGDIENDFDCVVGQWNTLWYYENQGTTLCFLKRVQDFFPDVPAGYSPAAATQLLDEGVASHADSFSTYDLPNIVIVMNESYAEISDFSGIDGEGARLNNYYQFAEESILSGWAYASCFGAGTCNSEFEVLTGASMANMGRDVYPYVLYNLNHNENLVTYLESFGYESVAMHPAEAKNWRRDRVYDQLGFNEFLDVTDFADADILRWYTTDYETYDRTIELIESEDSPQFILDITIQNHGGYTSGLIPEEDAVSITASGTEYLAVSEYAACVQRSDEDLADFLNELEVLDEDVIVLFFGDHQPSLTDVPDEAVYGKATDDMSLEELQELYEVPYLIWANYDTGLAAGTKLNTSLNYLGMNLVQSAGLPLSPYLSYLEEAQQSVPAINLNGFMTADGTWHPLTLVEEGAVAANIDATVSEALNTIGDYAIVQYANLFDAAAYDEYLVY